VNRCIVQRLQRAYLDVLRLNEDIVQHTDNEITQTPKGTKQTLTLARQKQQQMWK
jgi:hypothetical protein